MRAWNLVSLFRTISSRLILRVRRMLQIHLLSAFKFLAFRIAQQASVAVLRDSKATRTANCICIDGLTTKDRISSQRQKAVRSPMSQQYVAFRP
jgi:hypothetical protein